MAAPTMVRTDGLDRAGWLATRRRGIGGSDAAAILGLDPFKTPLSVYLDKRGELPDAELGEAAEWGNRLEPFVADAAVDRINTERAGQALPPVKARRRNAILRHPAHDWMLANVDREVLGHEHGPAILEVKTTGVWAAQTWEEDTDGQALPDRYHVQLQHYLAVTGRAHGWVAVLVGGQQLVVEHVDRDDGLIDALVEVCQAFWRKVQQGNPPSANAHDDDTLKAVFPRAAPGKKILLPDEARDLLYDRAEAKAAEKAAAERRKAAENRLRQLIGDAEEAYLPGSDRPVCTYRQVSKTGFDAKAFAAEHPDLAERYVKDASHRRFHFAKEISS